MSQIDVKTKAGQVKRYAQIMLALLRLEELNRRRNPMEALMLMMEPVFLIATLTTLWMFLGRKAAVLGATPVLFYATGLFIVYFFIFISRRMRRAVDPPTRRFPIERRLDHIVTHIVIRTFDYSVLSIPLFGIIYVFFDRNAWPHDWGAVLGAALAIIALSFGWGIASIALGHYFWFWTRVYPVINRSLLIFSGVFFLPDFVSPSVRYFLGWNPVLHAVALFRSGFYPDYPHLLLDTKYLAACALAAVAAGLVIERTTRKTESV